MAVVYLEQIKRKGETETGREHICLRAGKKEKRRN